MDAAAAARSQSIGQISRIGFVVNATFQFDSAEVRSGFTYGWRVTLWESDRGEVFGGGDDLLFEGKVNFFTPSSTTMIGTSRIRIDTNALGTESGNEEIYASVAVWNESTDGLSWNQRSRIHEFNF
jgi:hypothetical protein